jgi:aminomethyltransferase
LGAIHRQLGARMTPFGGYIMPMQYRSIREEHEAVRRRAGLFDVSHMGEVMVRGSGALDYLQNLVSNDVSKLAEGRALYGVMCREDGGIVDDLLVYRDREEFMCVINAARHDADLAWMRQHLPPAGVELLDRSAETFLIALQGPRALEILEPLVSEGSPQEIRYYHHRPGTVAGVRLRLSRTGYTGEDGFELYGPSEAAETIWTALYERGQEYGLMPAGLGARDTLRLEAGLRLYGQDIDEGTDPITAGLGWVVKLAKGAFLGSTALRRISEAPTRAFVGIQLGPRQIARPHQAIFADSGEVGVVTSGSFGFSVGTAIAMGYVRREMAAPGTMLKVRLRQEPELWAEATVVPLPFYHRPGQ